MNGFDFGDSGVRLRIGTAGDRDIFIGSRFTGIVGGSQSGKTSVLNSILLSWFKFWTSEKSIFTLFSMKEDWRQIVGANFKHITDPQKMFDEFTELVNLYVDSKSTGRLIVIEDFSDIVSEGKNYTDFQRGRFSEAIRQCLRNNITLVITSNNFTNVYMGQMGVDLANVRIFTSEPENRWPRVTHAFNDFKTWRKDDNDEMVKYIGVEEVVKIPEYAVTVTWSCESVICNTVDVDTLRGAYHCWLNPLKACVII